MICVMSSTRVPSSARFEGAIHSPPHPHLHRKRRSSLGGRLGSVSSGPLRYRLEWLGQGAARPEEDAIAGDGLDEEGIPASEVALDNCDLHLTRHIAVAIFDAAYIHAEGDLAIKGQSPGLST